VKPTHAAPRRRPPGSPFHDKVIPEPELFAVDDRVTHDTCGLGRVVAVEDDNVAVLVQFGPQKLRVPSPFSKLTKL
jgi:hypothetical protein